MLAQLIANYDEYRERVGIIDVPADFDPVKMITGGR